MLPVMVRRSGEKFSGVPAWMEHTAHTRGSSGAVLRLTTDWMPWMIAAAGTMTSTHF